MLDNQYAHLHHASPHVERSLLVFGLPESRITSLMEQIERAFSLPSVGDPARAEAAFAVLRDGVFALGGEIVDAPAEDTK